MLAQSRTLPVEAIRQASGKLKPARTDLCGQSKPEYQSPARFATVDTGLFHRRPSDKSVGVFAVEDYSSRPIAVLINYACP